MPEISQSLHFLGVFEPVFTKPTFVVFLQLVVGWVLCPSRRTITGMFPFADMGRKRMVQTYHYFFRSAAWMQTEVFATWAKYLVGRLFAKQKTLLLSIDDTTHKKSGLKVDGARVCRDAVRSTQKKTVFCWALQFVPLCLVWHPPWGKEPLSFPLNVRLNRKALEGEPCLTLIDHAVAMLQELLNWLPEHSFILVADGAYASLVRYCLPGVTVISRLRCDARLYELPPKTRTGKRGRPRTRGERLPRLSELARSIPEQEWRLAQTCERGTIRQRLLYSRPVIWGRQPLLLIISRDPNEKELDDYFFSTDLTMDAALAVSHFADRWSVEDTFRNVKQYLGAEQPQCWKGLGPERAGAFSYLIYGIVWLARIEREGENVAVMQREWYTHKDATSFLDAMADIRYLLWEKRITDILSKNNDSEIIQNMLVNTLAWVA